MSDARLLVHGYIIHHRLSLIPTLLPDTMLSGHRFLIPILLCLLQAPGFVVGRVGTPPPPGDPYADPQNDPYNPLRYITSNVLTGIAFGRSLLSTSSVVY